MQCQVQTEEVTSTRRRNGKGAVEAKEVVTLKKLAGESVANGVNGAHANGTAKTSKEVEAPAKKNAERSLAQDFVPFASVITLMGAITYFTMPESVTVKTPTVQHVWFYGWLAAITTGLGGETRGVSARAGGARAAAAAAARGHGGIFRRGRVPRLH